MFKLTKQTMVIEFGKYNSKTNTISYTTKLNDKLIDTREYIIKRQSNSQISSSVMQKFKLEVKAAIAIINADLKFNGNNNRIKKIIDALKK